MKYTAFLTSLLLVSGFGLGWIAKRSLEVPASKIGEIVLEWPEKRSPQVPTPESSVGVELFDRHHEKAVAVFDQLPGFGFSRILPVLRHDLKNPGPSDPTALFSEFDFSFIGNDASSRRLHSGEIPEIPAVFTSPRQGVSQAVPATGADLVALDAFEENPDSRRQFHIDGDSIVGYGPLRATASCAKCHGVEEGTLLGMFRYRFDLPLDPGNTALAVNSEP